MAQVYHPKKTSTKLIEGAIGGLLAGAVVALLMLPWDGIAYGNWFNTPNALGWLFTGNTGVNAVSTILGLLLHFILFALIGVGFTQYMPLVRRFKVNAILAGAIYGLVIGLLIFFVFFNAIKPDIVRTIDNKALLVANAVGGAALGWWLSRPSKPVPQPPPQA